jgi:hypothetical protein
MKIKWKQIFTIICVCFLMKNNAAAVQNTVLPAASQTVTTEGGSPGVSQINAYETPTGNPFWSEGETAFKSGMRYTVLSVGRSLLSSTVPKPGTGEAIMISGLAMSAGSRPTPEPVGRIKLGTASRITWFPAWGIHSSATQNRHEKRPCCIQD